MYSYMCVYIYIYIYIYVTPSQRQRGTTTNTYIAVIWLEIHCMDLLEDKTVTTNMATNIPTWPHGLAVTFPSLQS